MSTAALRHELRRPIGGRAHPRTLAAVEVEARRWLIHNGKPLSSPRRTAGTASSNTKSVPTSDEGRSARMGQIQKMKDELYSALAETERKNTIFDSLVSENQGLMEYLSVQVSPRPNDPHWRSYRQGKRINEFLRIAGIVFVTHMVADTLLGTDEPRKGKIIDYTEIDSELERDAITQ